MPRNALINRNGGGEKHKADWPLLSASHVLGVFSVVFPRDLLPTPTQGVGGLLLAALLSVPELGLLKHWEEEFGTFASEPGTS